MKNLFTKKVEQNKVEEEFGGLSQDGILKEIGKSVQGNNKNILKSSEMSEQSKNALVMIKQINESESTKYLDGTLLSEVAIKFSEGNDIFVENKLKEFIALNKGKVDKEYWYMLLDYYSLKDNKVDFEKVAITYSKSNNCSPPSWIVDEDESKNHNVMQNIIILNQLTINEKEEIKVFLKKAKNQKYCRIDVSKLRFENSTIEGIKLFLELMYSLRKNNVVSLILQDNVLTEFCLKYMKLPGKVQPQKLDPNFIGNEKVFWYLYLEVLQWKNREKDFEEIASNYASLYEESPPGWDNEGAMKVESSIQNISQNVINTDELFDEEINNTNVLKITNYIDNKKSNEIILDFKKVKRIDFTSSTILFDYLKKNKEQNSNKVITLINMNQFIKTIFKILEIDELLNIKDKKY